MKNLKHYIALLAIIVSTVFAQDGTLDPNFGTAGKVITDIGTSTTDNGQNIAIQDDGKILVCGSANDTYSTFFIVVRYNSDGTLDTSFDADGKQATDFGNSSNKEARVVLIQSDGKIILAGDILNATTDQDFALARYNSNGSLDNSFGTDGLITTDIAGSYDYLRDAVIQSDGKIVVVGASYKNSKYNITVVRYNADGTLDTGFGNSGIVTTSIGTNNDEAYGVAIQSDGKIILAGDNDNDFALVRLNS